MKAVDLAHRLVDLVSAHGGDLEVLIPNSGIPDLQSAGLVEVFDAPAHIDSGGRAVRERATTHKFVVIG